MNHTGVRPLTLKKIEEAIQKIYLDDPHKFKLSYSELERVSGVSRPTYYKKEVKDHIHLCISRLPGLKTSLTKSELKSQNDDLREQVIRLKKENKALLCQFTDLFSRLYGESVDAQQLISLSEDKAFEEIG
ncbi:hypothetical protein E7T06_18500 [Deinococcus sp. Arct2-2]|uniref:hypothetical protein n=1 Tax=Deinococcus sp. Arct2-2 TaxID=2568653 RepID=UPI0010A4C00E|nr:hypothetical protein [Deinococcus sp. Arct2-2]THF68028.1 hypothetical protein E7T06_18500 [Deinococcus sp. Arct2-2]